MCRTVVAAVHWPLSLVLSVNYRTYDQPSQPAAASVGAAVRRAGMRASGSRRTCASPAKSCGLLWGGAPSNGRCRQLTGGGASSRVVLLPPSRICGSHVVALETVDGRKVRVREDLSERGRPGRVRARAEDRRERSAAAQQRARGERRVSEGREGA